MADEPYAQLRGFPVKFYLTSGDVEFAEATRVTSEEFVDLDSRLHKLRQRANLESKPKPRMVLLKKAPRWVQVISQVLAVFGLCEKMYVVPIHQPDREIIRSIE